MEDLMLKYAPPFNETQINYGEKLMLIGSCFTEHIGNYLSEHKFDVLQNPNGILFDTLSVCRTLNGFVEQKAYSDKDIFQFNELWRSWQHHSSFSDMDSSTMLLQLKESKKNASEFLAQADWLLITLGSSFAYKLKPEYAAQYGCDFVANCHKAPANWFEKYLIPIEEQIAKLDQTIYKIRRVNPNLKVVFTISPVRHIRDGVVENNRSKARLLETVHHLVGKFKNIYYFAAYEMLIDVLRDYRFYDVDLVHPNFLGTSKVIQSFTQSFLSTHAQETLTRIKQVVIASKHRPFQPNTEAHKRFLQMHLEKTKQLKQQYSFLNVEAELDYFATAL